jgi:hypothetical protein
MMETIQRQVFNISIVTAVANDGENRIGSGGLILIGRGLVGNN